MKISRKLLSLDQSHIPQEFSLAEYGVDRYRWKSIPRDQAEGVENLANPLYKTTNANNVFAMIKNAFRAPSFAPVFA